MARKHVEEEHDNAERYLITYADLITLLLGLFIILYVSAEQDTAKYENMTKAMGSVFGGRASGIDEKAAGEGGWGRGEKEGEGKGEGMAPPRLEDVAEALLGQIQDIHALIVVNERGVVVSLPDELFFDSGSAKFLPDAYDTLQKIAREFRKVPNAVRVEGHADNRPIHTVRFSSNWHLSAARAVETAEFLIETGGLDMGRVSVAGYGDARPVATNKTATGRSRNRRVEIVLLRHPRDKKKGGH